MPMRVNANWSGRHGVAEGGQARRHEAGRSADKTYIMPMHGYSSALERAERKGVTLSQGLMANANAITFHAANNMVATIIANVASRISTLRLRFITAAP